MLNTNNHINSTHDIIKNETRIHFKVAYWTIWGEHLELILHHNTHFNFSNNNHHHHNEEEEEDFESHENENEGGGLAMSCYHDDKLLIWEIKIKIPTIFLIQV